MKLEIIGERCVGCRLCEMACTFAHEGVYGSYNARVHVSKIEELGIDHPLMCQQCPATPCENACPVGAISKNQDNGSMRVNQELCTGCGNCVKACPYGAATLHSEKKKSIICDLCGGSPQCVQECPVAAIIVAEDDGGASLKSMNAVAKEKQVAFARRKMKKVLEQWGVKN